MREVLYKKRRSVQKRRKAISISERTEDKQCKTHVRKNFVYVVSKNVVTNPHAVAPEVFVNKFYDSNTKEEKFSFRIKGSFYVARNDKHVEVKFCHVLNICIHWKLKMDSNENITKLI